MTKNKFTLIRVHIETEGSGVVLGYYTDIPVEVDDKVVIETKYGLVYGRVASIAGTIDEDPFNSPNYKAKCHVLENVTKKIFDKETIIMAGTKTVEVKHISSNRKNILYTDLGLQVGTVVVYERRGGTENNQQADTMSVGIVTNVDPDAVTATHWVVDIIDMTNHEERKERLRRAAKVKAKLDAKKKQFQDIELLRLIAQSDPETAGLLEEYNQLLVGK